ncbi:MAG: ABC transporter substrate-binding protein, partial [Nocardiaceae bacterium]|nr:ABC transporter substrate-binding protein [Nocardiaceae bacterium]
MIAAAARTRAAAVLVAVLLPVFALAACSSGRDGPADLCAPPGVDSATALPANLDTAAAATAEDKYTTPNTLLLNDIDTDRLGLGKPGTLTVGSLSDGPPSTCVNSHDVFTGSDNALLRAVAAKLGLQVEFVGTDFAGLLAQVAGHRFDVGSSSITTTDARRDLVGFTNGYDFGYFALAVPNGSAIKGFSDLNSSVRVGVVQGTVQDDYVTNTLGLDPVKFPDYNTAYANLKTGQIDAWVAPSQTQAVIIEPGDPVSVVQNTFSLNNFVAWAVPKDDQPLIDALNSGLDAVIADGTWSRLYSDWVPRALPAGW